MEKSVSAAYTTSPALLYPKPFFPKNPQLYSTNRRNNNNRSSLSVKASSSFKTHTLSSNWDVAASNYSAPTWMPRFEELDTTNMLLRQRIVFLGSQVLLKTFRFLSFSFSFFVYLMMKLVQFNWGVFLS